MKEDIISRWAKHYGELINTNNDVYTSLLYENQATAAPEELAEEPSVGEVRDALQCLKHGKAPGPDVLPWQMLGSAGGAVLDCIHNLIKHIWHYESVH